MAVFFFQFYILMRIAFIEIFLVIEKQKRGHCSKDDNIMK